MSDLLRLGVPGPRMGGMMPRRPDRPPSARLLGLADLLENRCASFADLPIQDIQCGGKYHSGKPPRLFLVRTQRQGDLVAPASLVEELTLARQECLLKRFASTIAGSAPAISTDEESQVGLPVVEAIYQAGATGRAVRLDDR